MLILAVIVFIELLKAIRQVGTQHYGRIVPLQGPIVQMELMLFIV